MQSYYRVVGKIIDALEYHAKNLDFILKAMGNLWRHEGWYQDLHFSTAKRERKVGWKKKKRFAF
jgi:hypothetical protein